MTKSIVEVVKLPEPKKQGKPPVGAPPPTATPTPKPAPATTTPPRPPLNPPPKVGKELIVFFGTLSLTRTIVFNGLVRNLATTKEKVFVVSAKQWGDSLKWMWGDLRNVEVVGAGTIEAASKMEKALTAAGKTVVNVNAIGPNWDRLGYERAGVSFEERWSKFVIGGLPINLAQPAPPPIALPQSPRYALIHDDAEKGWHIRKELLPKGGLKHIRLDKSHPNLFAWQTLIENATEIHCVPSAVAALADSIPTKAAKLTLHKYSRPQHIDPAMKKNWGVIA
jgi:hypothetical protein